MAERDVVWSPPPDAWQTTRLGRFLRHAGETRGRAFTSYDEAWRWSIDDLEGFWSDVWQWFAPGGAPPPGPVITSRSMPGARWFPEATLNYAAALLAQAPSGTAVVGRSQTSGARDLTGGELRHEVGRARAGLLALGVRRGDRVVAYLPNLPETLIAFLATASIGAVWSSCPPEFGPRGVIDRFSQIEPSVLLAVDGYRHRDAVIDRRADLATIRRALPSVHTTIALPSLGRPAGPDTLAWSDLVATAPDPGFEPVPFDHPLYVLYSSGTTGRPKAIVHGHGGILLEHQKVLALHQDLGPGDRLFWYTTTGWMMWNYLVSALAVGASIVLYDGDPAHPGPDVLWSLAEETGITTFGTSAPYLLACARAGIRPGDTFDLGRLVEVASTGAPLPAAGFHWVHDHVGTGVRIASMSGGTDVCTAFVGGNPLLEVVAGRISCRMLGAAVEAFDEEGTSVIGAQGDLVVTAPMPSMPVAFWGDPDGSRYRATYFERHPGVWTHGDWITIDGDGTCVISGRSDATLNRGGVRLGTSDFYTVVEAVPGVEDSLVVHLEDPDGGPGELLLFVQLAAGHALDDDLRARIAGDLRAELSPRHVPDEILAVARVPRTLTGKKLEVPVKRILSGMTPGQAASREALADPSALDLFEQVADRRRAARRPPSGGG